MDDVIIESNSFNYSSGTIICESVPKTYIMKQEKKIKMLCVKKGNVKIKFLDQSIKLNTYEFILFNKNVEIVIHVDKNTTVTYLQFSELFFKINPELKLIEEVSKLFNNKNIYNKVTFHKNHENTILHYSNILDKLNVRKSNTLNKLLIQNTIQQIILLTVSLYDSYETNIEPNFNKDFLDKLNKTISENVKYERSIKFYSEKLNINSTKLNKFSENRFGVPFKHYIEKRCINLIKSKLELDLTSLKEIAFEFNFSDISNFHRFFKRNTGITPTEYLKSISK